MRIPKADWSVRLYNEQKDEYETVEVTARTEDDAREAAIDGAPGEWEATVADRLCDLCKPAPHPRVEAYGSVTVIDESDVMDEPPGEFDAPERCAWVCIEHYQVVEKLPTYRSAKAPEKT